MQIFFQPLFMDLVLYPYPYKTPRVAQIYHLSSALHDQNPCCFLLPVELIIVSSCYSKE